MIRIPDEKAAFFRHSDALEALHRSQTLNEKLAALHGALRTHVATVDRIAVAAYDSTTDLLRTFLASSPHGNQLVRYESRLAESPSLLSILQAGAPRLVHDLEIFRSGTHPHTQAIAEGGYRWSYTVPMYRDGTFWGFVFLNSLSPYALNDAELRTLDVFAHLVASIVTDQMQAMRTLAAAVKTAHDLVHYRDPETGGHIDRMARYARLIAQHLAAHGLAALDDEAIERIYNYAPLHDIGKLALPDRILLKPGNLSDAEREEMKRHTILGLEMIDTIARNFGLEHLDGLDILRHIAESHHETMDGCGYPHGLHGDEIPIEARIVAVADIFDALTSSRTYKASWTQAKAFTRLRELARAKLDKDCVEALLANADKVHVIRERYADRPSADDRPDIRPTDVVSATDMHPV